MFDQQRIGRSIASVVLISAIGLGTGPVAQADLIAHWNFEEGSGSTALDVVGGHHGTIHGGAQYVADPAPRSGGQYALDLDGIDDFVRVPHSALLSFEANVQSFTVSACVKSSSTGPGHVIDKKQGTGNAYVLFINSVLNPPSGATQGIAWITEGNAETDIGITVELADIEAALFDGEWHHIAGRHDAAAQTLSVYVDGVLEGSASSAGAFGPYGGSGNLEFGARFGSTAFLDGRIDEIKIFDHALSLAELAEESCSPELKAAAVKDSFMRKGNPNRNEGANPRLRVRASGKNRALVAFDTAEVDAFVNNHGLTKATLILSIAENGNNWGADGRTVDAHPLLVEFAEGNGQNAGVPGSQSTRGSGEGVTWKCEVDTEIANQKADCDPKWDGGLFGPATALPVLHVNGLLGAVSWDVTDDVLAGATAWMVKKTEEGPNGKALYYAREGASDVGDVSLAPTLLLE